ncbi:ABC transporter permease [Ructibacterium gallinarum]|uniref:Sugar ABC transporter permease n=1 Tax=Ructibacterium gallinarum TaxID=2779355 RepID=A0A9D5LY10_9FIRM|nr:ABC transporter permease subunit [Ructibacterium gallinarum]MBE5040051.1 sugar ABC transporter permease [Ructibacterium gallinarum]
MYAAKKYTKKAIRQDWHRNWALYLLMIPVLLFYLCFCYKPMYGAIIAFKDYDPVMGILGSDWVGLKNFTDFFQSSDFVRVFRNTIKISVLNILFGFPAPIILALLINELEQKKFAKTVQTITYMPHFISLVVVCGLIKDFVSDSGVITSILGMFGFPQVNMLQEPGMFVPIYIISGIWQEIGWGSIIYLAALAGVDQQLYEAASIDGAGRLRQTFSVTLPGIMPTIVTMFILKLGTIMNVGFEKIILLYDPITYETADVISSYVYRKGIVDSDYGFSTAVGLFNSVINFALIIISNTISRRVNDTSLW